MIGAFLGLTSILLGAASDHMGASWGASHAVQTALHYHQLYALLIVLLGLSLRAPQLGPGPRRGLAVAATLFIAGTVVFCGGLYLADAVPALAYAAPLGGVLLMGGWAALGLAFLRRRPERNLNHGGHGDHGETARKTNTPEL